MSRDDEVDGAIREGARAIPLEGDCIEDDRLVAFYRDALAEPDADAVRAHLATCPRCLEAARDARRFLDALDPPRNAGGHAAWATRGLAIAATIAGIALVVVALQWEKWGGGRSATDGPWSALAVAPPAYHAGEDELVWRGEGSALDRAVERYRAGDWAAAAADLESHVAAHPHDARGRFYLGIARLLDGKPALAAGDLEIAREMPGSPAETTWYLALALLKSGELPRARVELERVAASDGGHRDEALALLARLGDGGPP